MKLKNLSYFCAAFDERSTVGAARVCHVTQPAISSALTQLEEKLGVRLFVREQRGLRPTHAAQRLYRLASKLLADSVAIEASFRDTALAPKIALRIQPSVSLAHTQRLLRQLRRELTNLEIRVVDAEQEADLTLTAEVCTEPGSAFIALWSETYALIVPDDHPLAVQEQIELSDLHEVAFIERSHCELASAWQAFTGDTRFQPRIQARTNSEEWALGLVAAGVGVTIAPVHAITSLEGVVLRHDLKALQGLSRAVGIAYHAPASGHLADVLGVCQRWVEAGWSPVALH